MGLSTSPSGGGGSEAAYLVYTALLTQTGTDAPVATVLQNTLGGTVVWTRADTGQYAATLTGVFLDNKTPKIRWMKFNPTTSNPNEYTLIVGERQSNDVFALAVGEGGSNVDDKLNADFIEIRVYP